ncbi:MAG: AlpA family phage regulatory protein [Aeromonas sp.]
MNTSCRILRLKAVMEKIGLARSTIYDHMDPKSKRYDADFPKPFKLGLSANGWFEHELDAWLSRRASMRAS